MHVREAKALLRQYVNVYARQNHSVGERVGKTRDE
jgi:hypothetical protein